MAVVHKRPAKAPAEGAGKKYRPPVERDVKPKIFHALKQAKKAADKAKTFEIQKLVKKLKTARAGAAKPNVKDDIPTLESQLQALKQLSADYIGRVALFSKLKKDKALSGHEEVKSALDSFPPPAAQPSISPHDELIRSRVLSNKHLASALQDALASLHAAAGLEDPRKQSTQDMDEADGDESSDEDGAAMDEDAAGEQDGAESGSDADIAMEDDEALGDGDQAVDDDGWESGSVDDATGQVIAYDAGSMSGSDEDEEEGGESDDDDDDEPRTRAAPNPKASAKAGASSSMFLPSLAVGFTRGDSDSDFSDAEAKVADGVRKNRRGQRARQAIWEKKYGRSAKHVQKRQELETRASAYAGVNKRGGRGGRGGATAQSHGRGGGRGGATARGRGSVPSRGSASASRGRGAAPPASAPPVKPAAPSKPMHPSWEAKQKQKSAAAIVPAKGQKIKFD